MPLKRNLLFVFAFLILCKTYSQPGQIHGIVVDELSNKPLKLASVCLIGAADSILYQYQRTDKHGKFHFEKPVPGKYILKVTYPQSVEFLDSFRVTEGETLSMDTVKIISQLVAIQEILIHKYNNGLRISGDTTEYLADFFKTNPGATVEDLLKKLPGIQVNKNGEITAQGQKVKKILVDGEEFFPDDPSIATKYLRADMIDKVQVYDEKKDTLTSSEEDKTRTLNLTLKDDKKKGVFGRAEAASDFSKYVNGGIFSGYFNQKLKAAAFVKSSNFENSSLSWEDRQQFGGAATSGTTTNYSNGLMYSTRNVGFNDELDYRGIPYNTSVGLVLNNTFSKKLKMRSSFRFANEGLNGTIAKNSRYFLPDTAFSINDSTTNHITQQGQRLNVGFVYEPDSFNMLDISNSIGLNHGKNTSNLISKTSADQKINENNRVSEKEYEKIYYNGNLSWQHKFRKTGRVLNANTTLTYTPNTQKRTLISSSRFFNEKGQPESTQDLRQSNELSSGTLKNENRVTFNNPINKTWTYSLYYNSGFQNDYNQTNTYNEEAGANRSRIDSLSSDYDVGQQNQAAGASLYWKKKKWSSWLSLGGGYLQYRQRNRISDQNRESLFYNILPAAGLNYSWKKQRSVSLSYNGNNLAPSLSYLQPLVNNNDPLNITVGNPNLVQSFNHSINANINSFQTLKGRYLWGYVNFNIPRNGFVNASWIDSNAVRRNMMVNANGNYFFNGQINYNFKPKVIPIYFSMGSTANFSRNITFINNERVTTYRQSVSGEFGISMESDAFEIGLNYELSYNQNTSSLSNQNGNSYIIQTPNYYLEAKIPGKIEIYTEGDFNIRPASNVFAQRNVYYINGGIKKQFGKKNNFEIGFDIHDLLNQNIGFDRNISTNLVTEELYTQLSRYWLIKARWNFASVGGDDD